MKRIFILFLTLLLMITVTGCIQNIALHQPESEIRQIDLVYRPFGEKEVLYTLAEDEIEPFLDALLALKLRKNWNPQDIGGSLIVQITYADGSAELLGNASIGYISDNTLEHDGWYYVSWDDLYDIFLNYMDIS